jgi:hypothetical protein
MDDFTLQLIQFAAGLALLFFLVELIRMMKGPINNGSCPPHSWKHDKDGQMYCEKCPYKPKEDRRGDYENKP